LFLQTNKQEKGGQNDTEQNKHQKLQNAASAQSIRAQNKTILWDGETKVKKRKKERKKKKKRSRTLTAAAAAALKSSPMPLRSFSAHDDERSLQKNQTCNKQTNNQQTKKKKKKTQQQQQRKPRFAEKPHLQSSLLTPVCHY
jgi:hypothetical protein